MRKSKGLRAALLPGNSQKKKKKPQRIRPKKDFKGKRNRSEIRKEATAEEKASQEGTKKRGQPAGKKERFRENSSQVGRMVEDGLLGPRGGRKSPPGGSAKEEGRTHGVLPVLPEM